ncbi:MAG: Rpn family recombination-promoting nuclease/putative transposase [Alphaproteobacteria bacterium]|nr:Rpn family recombination-promoting nuclease/putative transposase [Alphaproteobacteria bacterium]
MTEEIKLYKLTPTNDFVFKNIFGQEDSKICLISLLNAILDGKPIITEVTILNPEMPKYDKFTKESRLDIAARTDNGTIVNIEMQCIDTGDLESRSITYASKLVAQHTQMGYSYKSPKIISIWIIRDKIKYGPMASRTHPIEEALMFLNKNASDDYYTQFDDKIRIIFVHLSRFKDNKVLTTINKMMKEWVIFLDEPEEVENKTEAMNIAKNKWIVISGDKELANQLIAREKYEMDKASEIATAREAAKNEGIEQGKKEGKEEGLIEGEKKGIAKGIEKGLIEGEKKGKNEAKKELALNMKNQGLDDTLIAKCLNISIEALENLFA